MRTLAAFIAVFLPLGVVCAADGDGRDGGDDDTPERIIIQLPILNGQRVEAVRRNALTYRVVRPEMLAGKDRIADGEVYIEGKFDSSFPPNRIKLSGLNATVIAADDALKTVRTLKHDDNVWCCGSLSVSADDNSLELNVLELRKQPDDLTVFARQIAQLAAKFKGKQSREDRMLLAESAIELGRRIDGAKRQPMNFNAVLQLDGLVDDAYKLGLNNKELALKADDADGYFELAEQWLELRHNMAKCRELVLKCLKIDPDHVRASWVAENKFEMVKLPERGWVSKDEAAEIQLKDKIDAKRQADAKAALEALDREKQKQAVAERPEKLRRMQLALATTDPRKLEGALEWTSQEIRDSVEPGFGVEAVAILADLEDRGALAPGLNVASRNKFAEVRRQAYEALAWRSRIDGDREIALGIITDALTNETDAATARSGVEALVATKQKPAIGTLVASLASPAAPVRQEIITGLKNATGKDFATSDEWEKWWQEQ